MKGTIVLFFILCCSLLVAQSISVTGQLNDSSNTISVTEAEVLLVNNSDSTLRYKGDTRDDGFFKINVAVRGAYQLLIATKGYLPYAQNIEINGSDVALGKIELRLQSIALAKIKISGSAVVNKQDTIQYNASAYKTNVDATVEELAKKMPGLTLENGVMKAQGEDVKKVLVDGKPFFGDDATLALKNISADMVARIEVFDQWSDQAVFTGFDDGQASKTINIITKKNVKNGIIAKAYAGYGDGNKYQGGGNFNYFKDNRRFTLLALTNNINQSNFSMQDLTAATGSSAPPMILGRAGGPNNASNPVNNFMVSGQPGINAANSLGLNYSDFWGSKMKFTGSYFFNQINNTNNQSLARQYYSVSDTVQLYNENSLNTSTNYNHRANVRFEYYIDSLNSLIATPSFSLQSGNSLLNVNGLNALTTGDSLNSSVNSFAAQNNTYRAINDLLFRHRFVKKGRTLSFNVHEEWSNRNANGDLQAENYYFSTMLTKSLRQSTVQSSPNQSHAFAVNYTEPIGKWSQIQLSYKGTYLTNYLGVETSNNSNPLLMLTDSSLSNTMRTNFFTHLPGAAFRINKGKSMLSLGADYQYSLMYGDQTFPTTSTLTKTFQNILPNGMFRYKFSKNMDWRVNLRNRIDLPNASQLQEVWNNSNPLLLSVGNAALVPQNVWVLYNRFSYTNPVNAQSWMVFAMLRKIEYYVSNSTSLLAVDTVLQGKSLLAGTRYTQPINVDGYWNSRVYVVYGTPLKKLKMNLNLTTGFFSSATPTLMNAKRGISNSYSFNEAVSLSSNISENIDFTLSSTANYNIVNNSLQASTYNYFNLMTSAKVTYRFWKGLVLQSELNHTWYAGLNQNFNINYALWNSSVAKKIGKEDAFEIKLSVFDALQQNNSVSRTVSDTYVDDLKSLVLQRYFMLTATYKIKKLKTGELPIEKP